VEELDGRDTPLEHMARIMPGKSPAAVRAQLGRFGFSGDKATTLVGKLSGGERARLALALITREAPHLLILDEPTNHLDVDSREALVQALNAYAGAVVLVSHDRHMLELTADRLVLVDNGTASEFDGSLDDYTAFILSGGARSEGKPKTKGDRKAAAAERERSQAARQKLKDAEGRVERLTAERAAIDRAMSDPAGADPKLATLSAGELMKRRADISARLETAEAEWLELSETVEAIAA
jgi:ATP-binding cassette, subfamily F, member 3